MKISILDHGYVEFIESWGCGRNFDIDAPVSHDYEVGIVEAARQSTQGSFRGWEQDQRLLKYLYEHKHATPFEFAGMVIEVQAPIFVFREWHRHRTQSYNEMSARFEPLPDLYYEPGSDRVYERAIKAVKDKNKQAQGAGEVATFASIQQWVKNGWVLNKRLEEHYQLGLKLGVPKELARLQMPVCHYSRMRASANLRNWLAFMTLRCDLAAQWEIRQFANGVSDIIKKTFPRTWQLWWSE